MLGVLTRLKTNLRSMLNAVRLMRSRGFSIRSIVFWHLPAVFAARAWRVIARPLNRSLLNRLANPPRFRRFAKSTIKSERPRLFLIVMPFTLHFLLPCIGLLQEHSQLVLVFNGARRWERQLLRKRFPSLPAFSLWTIPYTSIAHSDVINLLLKNHPGDFGMVDHDCYVFDATLLTKLSPGDNEVLLAYFSESSQQVNMSYPLTHFLYFHTEPLREIMQRYRIDASLYREAPASTRDAFASLGLFPGVFLKHYHHFYDTLHVLLCVAQSEGNKIRYLTSRDGQAIMHVGGTSLGTHHTKGLYERYIHLRFLELLNDPVLNRRYAFLTAPLRSSAEALARRHRSDPSWQALPVVDALIRRLQDRLGGTLKPN